MTVKENFRFFTILLMVMLFHSGCTGLVPQTEYYAYNSHAIPVIYKNSLRHSAKAEAVDVLLELFKEIDLSEPEAPARKNKTDTPPPDMIDTIEPVDDEKKKTIPSAKVRSYSEKLGISLDGSENMLLMSAVVEWLGIPYKWGGCSVKGIDCSCLVEAIFKKVYGLHLKRTCVTMYKHNLKKIRPEQLREGDIVCFDTQGKGISHIGIYVKNGRFVHASRSRGVRISNLGHPYYQKRFITACRVKGLKHRVAGGLKVEKLVIID